MKSAHLKKLLSLLLVLVMCLSMIPAQAFAEGIPEEEPSGEDDYEEVPEIVEDPAPHQHDYVPVVTEPSCEAGGYTTWICSCGDSYVTDETGALGHMAESVEAVAPTCTAPGHEAGTVCAVCGEILDGCTEIPAAGHTAEETEAAASTCTKHGHAAGTVCAVCGEILTGCEELPLAEHMPEDVAEIPAEVGKPGKTAGKVCAVCGEVLEGCEEIPALEKPEVETVITIDEQPVDAEPVEGAAEFAVVASVNTEDELTYQWQRLDESVEYADADSRKAAWEDIENETNATLHLEGLDDPDTLTEAAKYAYRCILTAGEAEAVTKEVRVRTAPKLRGPAKAPASTTSGTCGENLTWTLDDEGTLTISGEGAMADYSVNEAPWNDNRDSITSIVVEDGVTSLGSCAFAECSNLTEITIPNSVTSIGRNLFALCSNLVSVTIPDGVTSIGDYSFSVCRSLTSVTIPQSVTSIGQAAFQGCSGLTGITLPAGLTSIGYGAFFGCSGLTDIVVPASVTSIGGEAFSNCQSLASVTLPQNVNCISSLMFQGCSSLTSITIPDGVTDIEFEAFSECSGLTSIDIPASVTSIEGSAFYGCTALTDVNYDGSQADWNKITIGSDNEPLTSAAIHYTENMIASGTCGENLTWTLDDDGTLTISGTGAITDYSSGTTPWYTYKDSINSVVLESGVVIIGRSAFEGCASISSVTIPEGVLRISDSAFLGCSALTEVELPTSVIKIEGAAFNECSALTDIAIPNGVQYLATTVFGGCRNLVSVTIPSSVTEIRYSAFGECNALTDVNFLGTWNQWKAITFSSGNDVLTGVTLHCTDITSGTCGENLTWTLDENGLLTISGTGTMSSRPWYAYVDAITAVIVESGVTSIGDSAFEECTSLTSITIPESVTSIGNFAFSGCSGLTSITIPEGVTCISDWAFEACSSLTSITIPSSVTSIGNEAFSFCSGLTSVSIPSSVTSIGNAAFHDCSSLTDVNYSGTQAEWEVLTTGSNFGEGNEALTRATLHCLLASGTCGAQGDNLTWTLDENGTLTISGTGAMVGDEGTSAVPWNRYQTRISSVEIENGVTNISAGAFKNYRNLLSVTIPDSVTSIGNYAFSGCSRLTNVIIPESVTSIGHMAFFQCTNLPSIIIPSSVMSISSSTFSGCSGLTSISICEGVTSIGSDAFFGCSNLTSTTIPASVTYISDAAFGSCSGFFQVAEDNPNYRSDGEFLYSKDSSTLIHVPVDYTGNFTIPESVTNISAGAFCGCSNLTGVSIPESVTRIGRSAFFNCTSLGSIVFPESVTSIADHVFYNCSALTDVSLSSRLTSIGSYAFNDCGSLERITIPEGVTFIGEYTFWRCQSLTSVTIPDGVTSIGEGAFSNCRALTELYLPSQLRNIGRYAFSSCPLLTSITIPEGVTRINEGAFSSCTGLTSMTIPVSVTSIDSYAFYGCTALTDVYYDGSLEQWAVLTTGSDFGTGNDALTNATVYFAIASGTCGDNLTWTLDDEGTLTISGTGDMADYNILSNHTPWFDRQTSISKVIITDGVTSIGSNAFRLCSELIDVSIPESVTAIGGESFADCKKLTSISMPAATIAIGPYAFSCSGLASVVVPSSVTDIGDYAFFGCRGLTDVVFQGNCLTEIHEGTFYDCSSINSIIIPSSVKKIGKFAFRGCTNLTNAPIPSSVIYIGEGAFQDCNLNIQSIDGFFITDNVLISYEGSEENVIIPSGVRVIGSAVFYQNDNIKSVVIPSSVESICDGAFDSCYYLTSVNIQGNKLKDIGSSAFGCCYSLTNIALPASVATIGENAFHTTGLTSITIPHVTSIGSGAFMYCGSLTSIEIPIGVESIQPYTFQNCPELMSVSIPVSTTSIGEAAFDNCNNLSEVIYAGTQSQWDRIEIGNRNDPLIRVAPHLVVNYSICFKANDAANSSKIVAVNSDDGDISLANSFTIPYKTFIGWNTALDGSGTVVGTTVDAYDLLPLVDDNHVLTLYAQWEALPYSIAFDANGAEGEMEALPMRYGHSVALTANTFTREGYTFTGWNTRADGWGKKYADGAVVSNLTATENAVITLYAQWKANSYIVHFDPNADDVTIKMGLQLFTWDKAAALRANAFKRPGFALEGWSTDPYAETATYRDKEIVSNLIPQGEITLYAIWKPLATSIDILYRNPEDDSETAVNGQTFENIDMAQIPVWSQFSARVEPAEASQFVTWKTSSAAIATVDDSGIITFHKPGTVTVTATTQDGTNKSAWVKFTVFYETQTARLTASIDATSAEYAQNTAIGLQQGDSAFLHIFGDDMTVPMDPALFTFSITTSGGDSALRVDPDGRLTSLQSGKTIAVKAELNGDPLKRSVSYSVKTIPVQTAHIALIPQDDAVIRYVDANGDLTDNPAEAVSYAIFVDTDTTARSYVVRPDSKMADGQSQELRAGLYTYASTNTAIATVTEVSSRTQGADPADYGAVLVTIRANATGACTVTATSKDTVKAQGSIAVYVMDYAPRLELTSVTLDSYKGSTAEVPLVYSYGNAVTEVEFLDGAYERASGHYTAAVNGIEVSAAESADGSGTILTLSATGIVPNKTIKGQLHLITQRGEYWLPLNVVSKSTLPTITTTQSGRFNVFYRDSEAAIKVTARNEEITDVQLISEDFTGTWADGVLTIRFANGGTAVPNTKATLSISLAGYVQPVEKAITIATVTTKPSYKLSATSGVLNTALGERHTTLKLLDSKSGEQIPLDENAVSINAAFAELTQEDSDLILALRQDAVKGGRVTFSVQQGNWTSAIAYVYTMNVTAVLPKLTPAKSTLTLNSRWPELEDKTVLAANQANVNLVRVSGQLLPAVATQTEAAKISVACVDGVITAKIADGETVKNGTYRFSFVPEYLGARLAAVTVNVTVVETQPTSSLAPANVSLSAFYPQTQKETAIKLNNALVSIASVDFTAAGRNAPEAEALFNLSYADGKVLVQYRDGVQPLQKAASYTYTVTPHLNEGSGQTAKPVTLTVRTVDDRPTLKLGKVTLTANGRFLGTDSGAVTLVKPAEGMFLENLRFEYTGTKASLIEESAKLNLNAIVEGGVVAGISLSMTDRVAAGSYVFRVYGITNSPVGQSELKPVNLTVRVTDVSPKVSLTQGTVTLNRNLDLSGCSYVVVGTGYALAGFKELSDESYAQSENVTLTLDGSKLTAALTDQAKQAVRNADYRITLTPLVQDLSTGATAECAAKLTLTVKNTAAAKWSVTVSPSGKLDAVQRESAVGMLTYTITGASGIQGLPLRAELIDTGKTEYAQLFNVGVIQVNAKGQPYVSISLKKNETYATNISYNNLKLRFVYEGEEEALSQALTLRVTQSTPKLKTIQGTQVFYQSQSRSRWVSYTVQLTGPADAKLIREGITVGNVSFWQSALVDQAQNILISVEEDGKSATIWVLLKDTSKLVTGRSYTLPLEFRAEGCAANVSPVKLNLTLKIQK